MTVDINVKLADEAMLDDLDEIMEDTMVQMFILQPRDDNALTEAQAQAREHPSIFYVAPLALSKKCDENCVGYFTQGGDELHAPLPKRPLFIEESAMDEKMVALLGEQNKTGPIAVHL